MSSADMRATETGAAAWARTTETCTTEMASAAAEMATTAAEVSTAAAAEVGTAAATDMTATAAATAAMAAASTASLRRGDWADQNDRQNNSQDLEFRHGTLDARGLQ
ncbi:MAG TPA: hypothetical protein VGM00_00720 [Bradyrhizobium sp.]|jgi:hypothetical protein